jgi:hypothetical protein
MGSLHQSELSMAAGGPEKIVFVGGAPRSGTTITHALLSTSNSVSEYCPEISFFRGIPISFRNGRGAWPQHTSAFFEDPDDFRRVMRETADVALTHVWRALGRPRILALKDPLLTPLFPDVAQLYPDIGYFVTVIRHPFDVVRSRQEVHDRTGSAQAFEIEDAVQVARDYMSTYRAVLNTKFGGRHFAFRYEDLNKPQIQEGLARFIGVDDLHARPMWGAPRDLEADPWNSPKYFKPIDLEPRLSPLAPALKAAVRELCEPMMTHFGYS